MAYEIVTLEAGGLEFRPVTIAITVAMDEAARSFEAKIKHPSLGQADLLRMLNGSPKCTIRARKSDGATYEPFGGGGDLMLTGHVEKRSPRLQGEEKELSVSGRSKTGDLVDSAAKDKKKKGEFRDQKATEVFGNLTEPFGLKVETEGFTAKAREIFRLRPGETVFTAMERWSRAEGFTVFDTPQGNVKLQRGSTKRHAGEIRDGKGLLPVLIDASAVHDDSKRHDKVEVKAQAPDGYAQDKLEIKDEASDDGVKRYRPRVIVPPEQVLKKDARDRAKWHRDRAAGAATTAEANVKGWRDSGGTLWTPGWTVYVEIADLGLAQDMLIKSATFEQSDAESGGTVAKLSLVDPRAFGGKGGKGGKSGPQWNLGRAGADDA